MFEKQTQPGIHCPKVNDYS